MLTMRPPSAMRWAPSRRPLNTPLRLIATCRSKVASSTSASGPSRITPALLTRTPTSPKAASAVSNSAPTAAGVAHIALDRAGAPARCGDLGDHRLRVVLRAGIVHDHSEPVAGEP